MQYPFAKSEYTYFDKAPKYCLKSQFRVSPKLKYFEV